MPYVEVWIDPADADLDVFSDDELREELNARARRKNSNPSLNEADYKIPAEVAKMTLQDAASVFRKQNRMDLAFKLDEIRTDYLN